MRPVSNGRGWGYVVGLDDGSSTIAAPPTAPAIPREQLADRYVGCLLGGAAGDALGRPVERWPRADVARRYPDGVRDFEPWHGWKSGPVGTITDDTQLSIAVAEWLCDAGTGELDGADFGRRVAEWGQVARGAGPGSSYAASRLAQGVPWFDAARPSTGNGVAMRSAPIGLRFQGDLERIRDATAISGITTHRDSTAIAGGVIVAAMVSHLLAQEDRTFDPHALVEAAVAPLAGVALASHPVGGYSDRRATLVELMRTVPDLLGLTDDEAFDHFYNGSFVVQSLPMTVWLFCRYGAGDPEALLVRAVAGGRDADTIAAMAGNLAGALHGLDAFPSRWTGEELEYRDRLAELAERLRRLRQSD